MVFRPLPTGSVSVTTGWGSGDGEEEHEALETARAMARAAAGRSRSLRGRLCQARLRVGWGSERLCLDWCVIVGFVGLEFLKTKKPDGLPGFSELVVQ